jgi:hypothetical protein
MEEPNENTSFNKSWGNSIVISSLTYQLASRKDNSEFVSGLENTASQLLAEILTALVYDDISDDESFLVFETTIRSPQPVAHS